MGQRPLDIVSLILGEDKAPYHTRTYTISARPEHLDQIEELFSWMNSTRSGHSGTASISIDGDGAARVTVGKQGGKLKKHDEDSVDMSKGIEFKVNLD